MIRASIRIAKKLVTFPFGKAESSSCWKMQLAVMLVVLLAPLGLCSAAYSYHLAQIPSSDQIDALAGKNLSWWFIALALFSISSWTIIVRWLLSQLMEQRKANTEATTQLIGYMRDDHASTKVLLEKVNASNDALTLSNGRLIAALEHMEKN